MGIRFRDGHQKELYLKFLYLRNNLSNFKNVAMAKSLEVSMSKC